MKLRCSNENCESRGDQSPMFNINMVVDEEKLPAENLNKIDPQHYECVFCHTEAEAAED